jgi:hypothetical protein
MFLFHPIPTPTCANSPTRLRVIAISPNSDWICGTYVEAGSPHWWKAKRDPESATDPWVFTCGLGPAGVDCVGRGINDLGDLVGFSSFPPLTLAMLIENGSPPADFNFSSADPAGSTAIYCIDNAKNIVGALQLKKNNAIYPGYPELKYIGFKTNATSPIAATNPELIYDQWSAFKPGELTIRGLNEGGDIVGHINSGTKLEAFIILNHGTSSEIYINVSAHQLFSGLSPTEMVISGINSSREFVGWHSTSGLQHGLYGQVDDAGNIVFLNEVNHSGAVTPNLNPLNGTQLFGISNGSLMAGNHNNVAPFLCAKVYGPEPRPHARPPLGDLPAGTT